MPLVRKLEQLVEVVAWELEAQLGVHRPMEEIPGHIADRLLDFFEITLLPGADVAALR